MGAKNRNSLTDQAKRFVLSLRLMANQAEQVQGVRIVRLVMQSGAVKQFRFREPARLVMMKRADKTFIDGGHRAVSLPDAFPNGTGMYFANVIKYSCRRCESVKSRV